MTPQQPTSPPTPHGGGGRFLEALFSLRGRVALVTGGSSGIGGGIAAALAAAGASVVLAARGQDGLDAAVAQVHAAGGHAAAVTADMADRGRLTQLPALAQAPFGPVDILVNAAGINLRPPLGQLTVADYDLTIAVNLTAPFLLGQAFGPAMARRGWGRIINITSQQATRAFGNSGAYGASKGGLAALTRSQAEAWSADGVCCNAISPGFVATPLTREVAGDPARTAAMAARTMTGRNGTPADFHGAAVFLASPAAGAITGHTLSVDGGFAAT